MRGLVIAGGGTGGHIYPAVAVAQSAKKLRPDLQVDFIGTPRGLETKIIPREGFPLHFVKIGALNQVNLLTKILTMLTLPLAILQGALLLLKLRPHVVLGVGGYASGPVLLAALLLKPFLRCKIYLFEANAMPGLTNRWLAKFSDVAFTNFQASNVFFKNPLWVGMPIRDGLKPTGREPHEKMRLLVFGGSQGARGLNVTLTEAVKAGGEWLNKTEIVHQIGSGEFKTFEAIYKKLGAQNVSYFEFLYDMPERYAWADIVLCRAGASTLAELAACQKAAILVPFPFASDNHQQKNAETLSKEGAAIVILQKDLSPEKLLEILDDLRYHNEKVNDLQERVKPFHRAGSSEIMARKILEDLH